MASFNRAIVMGNLGKDPEMRDTNGGGKVCNFSVAASSKYQTDNGIKESTEWFNIVVFGKTAENCAKYLSKGSSAMIEGRLQTRSWENKEGKKQYATEIVASNVQFMGQKKEGDTKKTTEDTGGW